MGNLNCSFFPCTADISSLPRSNTATRTQSLGSSTTATRTESLGSSTTATRTESLESMNSATGPSAAKDNQTFADSLRKALGENRLRKAKRLIQRNTSNRHQFPDEIMEILREGVMEAEVPFRWIESFHGNNHLLSELIATAFTGKCWEFIASAVHSRRACLIIVRYVKEKKLDLYGLIHNFVGSRSRITTLSNLVILLTEAGLYDTVKEILVSQWPGVPMSCHDSFRCFLQDLVTIRGKKLRKAFDFFRNDPSDCCQHVAIVLAFYLKDWKVAADMLKTGTVEHLSGSNAAFASALRDKAWECAILILYRSMRVAPHPPHPMPMHDMREISRLELRFWDCFSARPGLLKPFMQMSRKMDCHAAGALLATWVGNWGAGRDLLLKGCDDNASILVLISVLRKQQFDIVYDWLHEPAQRSLQPSFVSSLLSEVCMSCETDDVYAEASPLVELLIGRCKKDKGVFDYHYALEALIKHNMCALFRKFMAEGLLATCVRVDLVLLTAIDGLTKVGVREHAREQAHDTLLLCIEAGLVCPLNPFPSLMDGKMIYRVDLPLLRLLYDTGIMSSEALPALLQSLKDGDLQVPEGEEAACRSYLEQVTNTPRALENACCICLSRALGCDADRKQRALGLGLPSSLTRQILFQQA